MAFTFTICESAYSLERLTQFICHPLFKNASRRMLNPDIKGSCTIPEQGMVKHWLDIRQADASGSKVSNSSAGHTPIQNRHGGHDPPIGRMEVCQHQSNLTHGCWA